MTRQTFRVTYRYEVPSGNAVGNVVRYDVTTPEPHYGMYGKEMVFARGVTQYAAFLAFERLQTHARIHGIGVIVESQDDRLVIDYNLDAIATTHAGT